jgi:2-polyprenyl-3-methyl-5-hydroxy-6-metoxy-1,4-benzoquinol methylase
LRTARREALEAELVARRRAAQALAAPLAASDEGARQRLASLAEEALASLRRRVAAGPAWQRALSRLDAAWHEPEASELMDDPGLDEARRRRIVDGLDRFNRETGAYQRFITLLRPLLREDGTTAVLDLAAGAGGFALAVARFARAEGVAIDVTATDLRESYLTEGRAAAAREGLPVRFARQDALDLSNLSAQPPDVVVCTQALHHFPAGLVAVLFAEAARVATRGVLFIDGVRSIVGAAGLSAWGLVLLGQPDFVHDGVASLRRFLVPEELELLARLGPWGDGARCDFFPPCHCGLLWRR